MTKPIVAPYPFEKLKKYSSRDAELISRLASLFPGEGFESPLIQNMEETLKKYFGGSFRLRFESMFEADFERFLAGLPDKFVCFVVSLTVPPKKVMIEFDPDFSFAVIDHLLGGSGETPTYLRSITSLEEGILQFVCVRILKEFASLMNQANTQLKLDKILTKADSVAHQEKGGEPVVLLTFRVRINKTEGYVRLCLPHPALFDLISGFKLLKEETSRRFNDFNHFRMIVWGEVGKVRLTAGEVRQIRRGDIVLLDESYADFDGKKISGSLKIRMGEGTAGGIEGKLVESGERYRVKLEHVFNE